MNPGKRQIEVMPDREALMRRAAERFVAAAGRAVAESGRFRVALSGGSTPGGLYRLLASNEFARRMDWSRIHVFWCDERCVPPDDPASNYRMAREALLDPLAVPSENIHRIRGEADPSAAAVEYERSLRSFFRAPAGPPPLTAGARFDLILLGIGANGHTASLFPGQAAVFERERWVAAEYVPAVSMWRVTMTPDLINAAAEIWFLVSGREKAATLRRVLHGPYDPGNLPAQIIAPRAGSLVWLLDASQIMGD